MGCDESIIEVGRPDPSPSPFGRHVASPQSIILEEHDLDKVQIQRSKTAVTFF
jgi:hypothetical protein